MLSLLSILERAKPNQHYLKVVVNIVSRDVKNSFRRMGKVHLPQEGRGETRTMFKNFTKTALLREVNKTLVGVVHLILVLLKVVMKQVISLEETINFVASLAINILSAPLNYLQDLARVH